MVQASFHERINRIQQKPGHAAAMAMSRPDFSPPQARILAEMEEKKAWRPRLSLVVALVLVGAVGLVATGTDMEAVVDWLSLSSFKALLPG